MRYITPRIRTPSHFSLVNYGLKLYSFYHLKRLRNDTVIHRLFSLGANEAITENNVRSTKR